jgi:hypothetical protein
VAMDKENRRKEGFTGRSQYEICSHIEAKKNKKRGSETILKNSYLINVIACHTLTYYNITPYVCCM